VRPLLRDRLKGSGGPCRRRFNSSTMHLLLFTQYFPPEVGAPQTRLDAMTRLAVRSGHRVTVVTAMPSYPTDRVFDGYRRRVFVRERDDGREIIRTWALPALGTGARRMAGYASFAGTGIAGLLIAQRPDVLIVESPPLTTAVPGLLWARARRVPAVFNVADLWPDAAVSMGGLRPGRLLDVMFALERWSYRHSALVTTVTEGVADRLVREKGVAPEKLMLVPNGVDTAQFSPAVADRSALAALQLADQPLFVYAGTMSIAHGLDALIDAFIVLSSVENAPQLVFIGAGSERARLEQRVRNEGVRNIHFRDPVPPATLAAVLPFAVAGVVTMADLALNLSTRPAKLFPLMAAGIPVLFAGPGEGAAAVSEARAGLTVQNSASAIAEAAETLTTDPRAARAMGAAGRRYVEHRWSWERIVNDWLTRLEDLVAEFRKSTR
jgi:colanic acid biosynthesis glycosyl transferase WcaI